MKFALRTTAYLLATTSFATLAHAGEVSGTVSDATQTRPLQSATVTIEQLARRVETDRDGAFVFADVPDGEYTVTARYVGAETQSRTISVTGSDTVRSNFALTAAIGDSAQILVVGQAASQASALSRERAADGIESVLTRDTIGQFPDQNAAESLRRLPGVNILNDQGEGRFVSVRGLDPELNSSSLNGVRLPAPESDIRAVALDVVSSDTIESIEVKKSFTPDMDGDFIGASVEINTTSAFDRKKPYYAARVEGSWNEYAGNVTPKGALDFSTPIGDNFGVAGSVSYYKREFETDNVESDFWARDARGNAYSESLEYRDYDVERTRINAALSFDARVSDTTKAFVRGTWAQFDDQEYRRRTTFVLGESSDSTATSALFDDADERIEIRRDLKDRFERQRIQTVSIGSDTDTGAWKFNWLASYAKSTENENFSIDPTRFRARFDDDGVALAFDNSGPYFPTYSLLSSASLVNDPSEYAFNRTELTTNSDSQDEEWAAKADLARTFSNGNGDITLQVGAKARWREKSYDFDFTYYGDYDGDYTLADVLGAQTYRLLDMGPVASKAGPADFLLANMSGFEVDAYETGLGSITSDYSVREDIVAGYGLARFDSTTLRVIAGVRMEHTHNVLNGNLVTDTGDTFSFSPVSYTRNYSDWLPSVTFRFSPQDRLVARGAVYKTVIRPKLSQLAPRYTVNDDNEAEFGNPDLKPFRAWNADFGFAYYTPGNGALSFGAFYKSVRNYAVSANFADYAVDGVTYDQVTLPVNGDSATVVGFEASYSQAFTMLPAPFDGLLTQLNYTYTNATGTLFDGRRIPLPAASKNTFNAVVGYEKGPIELRAAGSYRDGYLDELGSARDTDRYVQPHFQLDLSAKLKLTENVRLTADWINVNNAKYFAYQNFAGARRLLQFEEYGPTVKFGARVNF